MIFSRRAKDEPTYSISNTAIGYEVLDGLLYRQCRGDSQAVGKRAISRQAAQHRAWRGCAF